MQVILHKTAVEKLEVPLMATGVSLGDALRLEEDESGEISVSFLRRASWLALIGRPARWLRLGQLCEEAGQLIAPALRDGVELRVRVVEISPAHLSASDRDALHLSVWGDRARLARAQARHQARAQAPSGRRMTNVSHQLTTWTAAQ